MGYDMRFLKGKTIRIERDLSDLDRFTVEFIRVLRRHTRYVIVSGYVSILLGRARSSEDVDIIIPKMERPLFSNLVDDLKENGFWCLQTEKTKDIYDYHKDNIAVRFAKKGRVIPNIELKASKNIADKTALDENMTVKLKSDELTISNLELQVAFKEAVLKSPKDVEDARHIRNIAGTRLDSMKVTKYKRMLHELSK